jgi:hypothetical protein
MCIVIVKDKKAPWPSYEAVAEASLRNPDGFAAAWNEGGVLKTYRTLRRKDFLKMYVRLVARLAAVDTGCVIHCRIMTHGSKKIQNCHCWTGSGMAFAHNGVLRDIDPRGDMTDSETFFRDVFQPVLAGCGWCVADKVARLAAGGSSSKFAFIDAAGNVRMYGQYVQDGGVYYSNRSYKKIEIEYDKFSFKGGWLPCGGHIAGAGLGDYPGECREPLRGVALACGVEDWE